MKTLKENSSVNVEGHVLIKDFDSGEVLLDKYNAINFQNFALAVAKSIANQKSDGKGYFISKLAFGYGGTTIDASGNITYNEPKVSGETSKGLYTASKDNLVTPAVDLQVAVTTFTVNDADNQPYSDLECKVILDYDFPADAATVDNYNTGADEEFVFDEIGLMTEAGTYLTHLIFHPIQKSKNRKLEILYTLRIRAGV
tara:strand:+ start:98 stop:694 length:597 start_codon:yes stop_codon:yes gene_type:complete